MRVWLTFPKESRAPQNLQRTCQQREISQTYSMKPIKKRTKKTKKRTRSLNPNLRMMIQKMKKSLMTRAMIKIRKRMMTNPHSEKRRTTTNPRMKQRTSLRTSPRIGPRTNPMMMKKSKTLSPRMKLMPSSRLTNHLWPMQISPQ